jgi:hypothetical protein
MNRATRGLGLLLLTTTAACAADLDPPSAEPPAGAEASARAVEAPSPAARKGARFSSRVLERLAERGIEVHGGPKPIRQRERASEAAPERTTVEQKWKVQGHTMQRVEQNNPTTAPYRYAVQLSKRVPLAIKGANEFFFDPERPGMEDYCSGTLVGNTAVLTAAHCITEYVPVGVNPATGAVKRGKVYMYSIDASPRRNGSDFPVKPVPVKRSFWEFSNWPGNNPDAAPPMHYDYAVVRLKRSVSPPIPVASHRVVMSPTGKTIETAHYPFQLARGFRMFYSVGDIAGLIPSFPNVYEHNASSEPNSSGAGIFEAGVDSVVGVNIGEAAIPGLRDRRVPDQTVGPLGPAGAHPNNVLMLTSTTDANVTAWINTLLL